MTTRTKKVLEEELAALDAQFLKQQAQHEHLQRTQVEYEQELLRLEDAYRDGLRRTLHTDASAATAQAGLKRVNFSYV